MKTLRGLFHENKINQKMNILFPVNQEFLVNIGYIGYNSLKKNYLTFITMKYKKDWLPGS